MFKKKLKKVNKFLEIDYLIKIFSINHQNKKQWLFKMYIKIKS